MQTNNNYLVLYLSWLVKTIVALHKLVNNKIEIKEGELIPEKKDTKTEKEKNDENDKDKKDEKSEKTNKN